MENRDITTEYTTPMSAPSAVQTGLQQSAQPEAQTGMHSAPFTSLHSFETPTQPTSHSSMQRSSDMPSSKLFLPLCLIVIIAGAGTGLGLNKLSAKTTSGSSSDNSTYQGQTIQKVATDTQAIQNGQIFGSANENDFKDSAEGYLEAGGIDGEGSHHLLREGGVSQTVYLTSSVTDLSKFEGMNVKVWGETFKGQKAGWLMDVGRVQVENTKGTPPASK